MLFLHYPLVYRTLLVKFTLLLHHLLIYRMSPDIVFISTVFFYYLLVYRTSLVTFV